jgi:hypothetical protein
MEAPASASAVCLQHTIIQHISPSAVLTFDHVLSHQPQPAASSNPHACRCCNSLVHSTYLRLAGHQQSLKHTLHWSMH